MATLGVMGILQARDQDIDVARELFATLPGRYAPPRGRFLLAWEGAEAASDRWRRLSGAAAGH
jgi:hypothetical protein